MNEKKIAFIICVNNSLYFEECRYYIEHLNIPEGFEIDVLAIQEADSMCAAYNLGMNSTDAKYKVYMHQDVFIRNKDFLKDIITIFEKDKTVGMIGMIGGNEMPKTAVTYLAWNVGLVDCRDADMAYYLSGAPKIKTDAYVEAIDGLLMVTQYDVPWREDLFKEFDFYDVSASFEMRRKGYQVLVPYMKEPWVIHDSSFAKLSNYDKNRKICQKEYPEFLYSEDGFTFEYQEEWELLSTKLADQLKNLISGGEWETVCSIIGQYRKGNMKDSTLEMIGIMADIWKNEQEKGVRRGFFEGLNTYAEVYEKYITVRFLLRRIELNISEDVCREALETIKEAEVSCEAVILMVLYGSAKKYKVLQKIEKYYQQTGAVSFAVQIGDVGKMVKGKKPQVVLTKRLKTCMAEST